MLLAREEGRRSTVKTINKASTKLSLNWKDKAIDRFLLIPLKNKFRDIKVLKYK